MVIDTHAHLDFFGLDLGKFLDRARAQGVEKIISIGTKGTDSELITKLAGDFAEVFCAVGIHPDEVSPELRTQDLQRFLLQPKVVGVGETGLDLFRGQNNLALQRRFFLEQIELANRYNLTTIIHSRAAEQETLDTLNELCPVRGVLHCFTGSWNFAKQALDRGLFISLSGIISFKNARELQEVVRKLPRDRVVIETDSPFLAPEPFRGQTNEPAFVVKVAQALADLWSMDLNTLMFSLRENTYNCFNFTK